MRKMHQKFPNIYPRIQVVPFQHVYKLLADEDVDVVINFKEPDTKKTPGTYKHLVRVHLSCVCAKDSIFSKKDSITIAELSREKLILTNPNKAPANIANLQASLMNDRGPSDFYFSDSIETAMMLAEAGFGAALLPDIFVPPTPNFSVIPVEDCAPFSFGVYYKTLKGNPFLKEFIRLLKEELSAAE